MLKYTKKRPRDEEIYDDVRKLTNWRKQSNKLAEVLTEKNIC